MSVKTPLDPLFMEVPIYKTWMEGIDIPNKNPYFFVTTEPNQMGFLNFFFGQNADN